MKPNETIHDFAARWLREMPEKPRFTLTRFQLQTIVNVHVDMRDRLAEIRAAAICAHEGLGGWKDCLEAKSKDARSRICVACQLKEIAGEPAPSQEPRE